MTETGNTVTVKEQSQEVEILYYCERHGIMNKPADLKEKADEIASKA